MNRGISGNLHIGLRNWSFRMLNHRINLLKSR